MKRKFGEIQETIQEEIAKLNKMQCWVTELGKWHKEANEALVMLLSHAQQMQEKNKTTLSKIVKKHHPYIWHTRRNSLYENKHPSERRGETASDLWKRGIALEASGEQEARTLGETGAPPGRQQVRAGNLNGNSTTSEGKLMRINPFMSGFAMRQAGWDENAGLKTHEHKL